MSNDNKFSKRAGTTDVGKEYENEVTAYFLLDFMKNEDIRDFKIWSNDDNFGAFDDVVVEVKATSTTEFKYALQLKHVVNGGNVSLPGLASNSGDFSLPKYFKSFKEIEKNNSISGYKMILWTNLELDNKIKIKQKKGDRKPIDMTKLEKEIEIKIKISEDGEEFEVKVSKCDESLPFLNISGNCFKFEIASSSNSDKIQEYRQFFEVVGLYTNQLHRNQMRNKIKEKLEEVFSDTSMLDNYLKFITNWSNQEGHKFKATKEIMQKVLTFCLPDLQIYPFVFDPIDERTKLLEELVSHFKVITFNKKHLQNVRRLWGHRRNELGHIFNAEIEAILKQYQLIDNYNGNVETLSEDVVTKLLWVTNKCPLIIEDNSSAQKAIKLCPKGQFVLIRNGGVNQNLQDLKNTNIFEKIKQLDCTIINQKFKLDNIIKMDDRMEKIVTTDELLSMAFNNLSLINQKEEKLPDFYIERFLSKNTFNLDILNNIDDGTSCVISNMGRDQEKYFRNFNLVPIEETGESGAKKQITASLGEILVKKDIYISRNGCSYQQIENLSKKLGKNVHHFILEPDGKLEWITTIGGISDLQQFPSRSSSFVDEKNFYNNPPNKIQLIVDDPGAGKSVLLKSIKNHLISEKLAVILTPDDMRNLYKENHTFTTFILENKYSTYTKLEKEILKWFIQKGEIFLLWDGLDEISEENRHIIRKLILELAKTVAGQWITTRPQLGDIIEEEFALLSRKLQPFNPHQQEEYIKNRLNSTCSEDELQTIIPHIKNNIPQLSNLDLLGMPPLYMMTELFSKNPEKYITLFNKKPLSIVDLYDHFIEEQFNPYFIQLNVSDDTHCKQLHMKSFKNSRLRNYKEVALKTMFDDDFIEEHNAKCDDFFEEIKTRDYVGLITTVAGEKKRPYFIHNSYAEYFIAKYLVENHDICNLGQFIFQRKFRNVRFFFDLMVAENDIHIATLCKNLEFLKLHENELESRDKCGRNCLHLAASWGENYPLLEVTKKSCDSGDVIYILDDYLEDDIKEESPDYIKMLQFLLERCSIDEKDQLFGFNAIEYAQKAGCLFPIIKILQNNITDEKIMCNILYYSAKFDLDVLDMCDFSKYVETTSGKSLLHIAIENNCINLVEKLLLVEKYKKGLEASALQVACRHGYVEVTRMLLDAGIKFPNGEEVKHSLLHAAVFYGHNKILELLPPPSNINQKNQDGYTPLHIACIKGHEDIVETLARLGAAINSTSENGMTPLYIAAYNGYEDIVEYLLKKGGTQVDAATKEDCTPLFAACARGHKEVAKLLLSSGAQVNKATRQGFRPLEAACLFGHREIGKMLLECGATKSLPASDDEELITLVKKFRTTAFLEKNVSRTQ